ncbi:MAG: hypothetical protein ACRDD1_00545, partial [Planctomycetia bacterium]
FGDAGTHQVDLVWHLSGLRPRELYASSEKRASKVEIVTTVLAKLHDPHRPDEAARMTANFVGSANHFQEDIHFHCWNADLLIRGERVFRCHNNVVEELHLDVLDGAPDQAFVDAVLRGDDKTASPSESALTMFDWTEAVLRSLETGGWTAVVSPNSS